MIRRFQQGKEDVLDEMENNKEKNKEVIDDDVKEKGEESIDEKKNNKEVDKKKNDKEVNMKKDEEVVNDHEKEKIMEILDDDDQFIQDLTLGEKVEIMRALLRQGTRDVHESWKRDSEEEKNMKKKVHRRSVEAKGRSNDYLKSLI